MLAIPWPHDVWARVSTGATPAHCLNGSLNSSPEIKGMWNYLIQCIRRPQAEEDILGFFPSNHQFNHCHYSSLDLCPKALHVAKQWFQNSSGFISGALGYSCVNIWNMLQQKHVLLTSEVRCRCITFTNPEMENLCFTACLPHPLCTVKSSDFHFI